MTVENNLASIQGQHRGEAELRSTCDKNMNDYDENQT